MNTKSIRFRLTLWYSTALIISIAVIFASFYYITQQELYRHTDIILISHAKQVAQEIKQQFEDGYISSRDSLLYNEFGVIPGMMLVITDKEGKILNSTYPNTTVEHEINGLFQQIKTETQEKVLNQSFPGSTQRTILIPLRKENELIGVVMMGHPIDVIQKSLNSLLTNLISLFALLVVPTIFGGLILAKRAMQPVNTISEQMQRITSENLKERVSSPQTHDEIETLVLTFNNLLTRLEAAFTRERQFIGDVAHELKTPLATQQSTIEVLLSKKRTNEDYQKAIADLLIDNKRLTDTVKDVLDLAWAETDKTQISTESTNLTELMEELYEITAQLAKSKGLEVVKRFEKNVNVYIPGKRDKIFRALLNIVDNAIKYTRLGTISLSLTSGNGTATIRVKDTGEGVSADDAPHLFDRFYRGKNSHRVGGTGLGLAIAYSIVTSCKGSITVKNNEGKGSTFIAIFPKTH
ncbi:TPA: hypothetical protein DIV55_06125 [Patescibacteria group bacterium]|uniref:histidine kinase n=1 Tax=Candidatus Gottesmanbacteria bacterium GW2011_GWA1_43_11 TaxID=1618436 RepID=A0A0G1FFY0_9BACT|nr:MAG: Integral membrane sensor signal transduction histidine kinase [Candidatus Gottesmanbacteria bacterium GW2011_GWA1_43_11]HCS79283.1 hypothetical protein [Patescibacteria group bacterium]